MFTKGQEVTISTTDETYKRLNGARATVVRVIDKPDELHDAESLPMYAVRTSEGHHAGEFWADELTA